MPVVTSGATTVGAVQLSGLAPNSTPIESWLNGMLQGKAFGYSNGIGANATQYSVVQLANPTGSGVNLWVYMHSTYVATASLVYLFTQSPPTVAGGALGWNLSTGLASGHGLCASANIAALPTHGILAYQGAANANVYNPYPWVIVLPPNTGLEVCSGVINIQMNSSFQWMEV